MLNYKNYDELLKNLDDYRLFQQQTCGEIFIIGKNVQSKEFIKQMIKN